MTFTAYDKGRGGVMIDRIYIHHCASTGTPAAIRDYWERTQAASAHYIIGVDGSITAVVPIQDTAWAVIGSNQRSISIECVNESGDPTWGISPETARAAGILAGSLARELGWEFPNWGERIRPHSQDDGGTETYCPGALRDDPVTHAILLGGITVGYAGHDIGSIVTASTAKSVQSYLGLSLVDGIIGPQTITELQRYLSTLGFGLSIDGEIGLPEWMRGQVASWWPALIATFYDGDDTGSETISELQAFLNLDSANTLDVDGLPGRETARAFVAWAKSLA